MDFSSPYPASLRLNGRRLRSVKLPSDMIVIMLHGLGADCNDMFGLFPHFAAAFPTAEFFAPDAPIPYGGGYQWFNFESRSHADLYAGVNQAAPYVNELINALMRDHNIPASRVVLGGFSQGAMTAMHVALRRPEPLLGVLAYSGMLIAPAKLTAEMKSKTPVCLVHGKADPVVPFQAFEDAMEDFDKFGVPYKAFASETLGHSIDMGGLKAGIAFIQHQLSGGKEAA